MSVEPEGHNYNDTEKSTQALPHLELPLLLVPPRLKRLEGRRLNHALVKITFQDVLQLLNHSVKHRTDGDTHTHTLLVKYILPKHILKQNMYST